MKKTWNITFEMNEHEYREIDTSLAFIYTFITQDVDKGSAKASIEKLIKYFSGEVDNK